MSYSFSVRAHSKAMAKELAANEFARVVDTQPEHAADVPAAKAFTEAAVGAIDDSVLNETTSLAIEVSGSVSWKYEDAAAKPITGCGFNARIYLVPRSA